MADIGYLGKNIFRHDVEIKDPAQVTGSNFLITGNLSLASTVFSDSSGELTVTGSKFLFKATTTTKDKLVLRDNSDNMILQITSDKAFVLPKLSSAPTAVTGGIYYKDTDEFYMGFDT